MTNQHPITPPPELVQEWWEEADQYQDDPKTYFDHVATQAAQWGADQKLEACCKWLEQLEPARDYLATQLRAANPPTLKERALGALGRFSSNAHTRADEMTQDFDTIRRALESLDD